MSGNFVDFKQVKELASIEGVLARYQVQLRRVNKNSLRGKCPLPTHSSKESSESFCIQVEKKIWSCQSQSCVAARDGKKGGNILDLVAVMESCSIRDAALKLQEWFSIVTPAPAASPSSTSSAGQSREGEKKEELVAEKKEESGEESDDRLNDSEQKNKILAFTLKDVDPSHPYLRSRGIKEETAKSFGVGFFPGHGSMLGRVVIPIHNEHGELIAYAGRSIDGNEPKYKLPPGFKKSIELFNLHRVRERDHVIIVEGFFDCLKVWQSGSQNVVALMGCSLSEHQEKLLRRFESITLFLDGDDAGREAADEIASRLVRSHFVRIVELDEGKQPDHISSDDLRSLLQL